jgi:hypothetical protein
MGIESAVVADSSSNVEISLLTMGLSIQGDLLLQVMRVLVLLESELIVTLLVVLQVLDIL